MTGFIGMLALIVLAGAMQWLPPILVPFTLAAAAALIGVRSPEWGIGIWAILLPFELHLVEISGMSPYVLLTPAVIIGMLVHVQLTGKSWHMGLISWMCTYLAWIFLAGLITQQNLRVAISQMLSIGMVVVAAAALSNRPLAFQVLCRAIFVAALISTAYAVLNWAGTWRLSINENTRALANSGALILLVGIASWVQQFHKSESIDLWHGYMTAFRKLVFVILGAMLILVTVSRGAIVSVIFSALSIWIVSLVSSDRMGAKLKAITPFAIGALIMASGLVWIDQFLARGQIFRRLLMLIESPGGDTRFKVWATAVESMNDWEWVTGIGLGRFDEISYQGYYAHGVFWDALVTVGIVGLGLILLLLLAITATAYRRARFMAIGTFTFIVITFSVYGSLSTKWFWFFIVFLLAISAAQGRRVMS